MIKYRTRWEKIEELEVFRETEKQVVLLTKHGGESREAKRSEWSNWHDTWEDAHNFIISKADAEVRGAKFQLEQAEEKLSKVKAMKPPVTGENKD